MKFFLCLIASGIGASGLIYVAAACALFFRREWKDALQALALCAVPLGIYAVAWRFLPLENWLIVPGLGAVVIGTLTFFMVLKNGA